MIPIAGRVTGLSETTAMMQQIPSLLRQMAQAAMRESLEYLSTVIRTDFLQGPYPQEIERRSGSFRATFQRGHPLNIFEVQARGTTVTGTFGSTDKRARILNEGGTIRPVRSQYLAVRTEFTKTPRGVVREKYQQPLRNLPNTFVRPIRAPKARAAVFERIGRRLVPIAWLVREVTIKGRHFMERGSHKAAPGIHAIFQGRIDAMVTRLHETLRRVSGGR